MRNVRVYVIDSTTVTQGLRMVICAIAGILLKGFYLLKDAIYLVLQIPVKTVVD